MNKLIARIPAPWPDPGEMPTLWGALRSGRLKLFQAEVYWRYLKPMPKLPPLPRRRDRVRRQIIWRRDARIERWALRPEQWARVCVECQRWIAPVGLEGLCMLCYADGKGHVSYYHHRCWKGEPDARG